MSCPACGVGMIQEDVQDLINQTLADMAAHDHIIAVDGNDIITYTQDYTDGVTPDQVLILPGVTAVDGMIVDSASKQESSGETISTSIPATGTWTSVGSGLLVSLPAGWGSMAVSAYAAVRFEIPASPFFTRMGVRVLVDGADDPDSVVYAVPANDFGVAVLSSLTTMHMPSTAYTAAAAVQPQMFNFSGSSGAVSAKGVYIAVTKSRLS